MANRIHVTLVIEGGVLQEVFSDDPDQLEVKLIDWDNVSVDDVDVDRRTPHQLDEIESEAALKVEP